jgi:hypothetical protein
MKNPRLGSGDVFRDVGFSPEEAVELRFKAELYQAALACARPWCGIRKFRFFQCLAHPMDWLKKNVA